MFKWIKELFTATRETTETIVQIGVVVSMLGGIGYALGNWFTPKNTFQWVSFFILVSGLLTILVALFFNWRRKKDIERIPDLIEKLDVVTSNFVDDFNIDLSQEDWGKLNHDYGNLLGVDLTGLQQSLKEGEQKDVEKAFEGVSRAYNRKLDPNNKTAESLTVLGDMSSILDTYNSGFSRLKSTPQYQKLDRTIKALQRKAPSAYISVKVNDYYVVSERLYSIILGTNPMFDQPLLQSKLPTLIKAKKSQIRPLIDSQIALLIAGVREAILKYKERNQEQSTPPEQKPQEVQNRAARRQRG